MRATFAQTLRHRISIQVQSQVRSGGQRVDVWTELRKAWADVRFTGGLEAIRAGAVTGTVNASIRIRYCTDVDASMRVVHAGRTFKVVSALPGPGQAYLDLVCEAVK